MGIDLINVRRTNPRSQRRDEEFVSFRTPSKMRPLALLLLLLGFTLTARCAYVDLTQPSLAFPRDFPESTKTNILARLRPTDCKFIEGWALNASTTLKYAGDTAALNRFLQALATCPGIRLYVCFADNPDEDSDWMLTHNAHQPGYLETQVNLKSKQIKLDALAIPEIKGPTTEAK
jgi:hypothetical protein